MDDPRDPLVLAGQEKLKSPPEAFRPALDDRETLRDVEAAEERSREKARSVLREDAAGPAAGDAFEEG